MKSSIGVILFAVIFICNEASAQKHQGRCPASQPTFGICTFDPKVNCVEDSECQGGQLCCPSGCNKVCKDPEMDSSSGAYLPVPPSQPSSQGMEIKHCPQPSGLAGICSYDENVNCLGDDECKNGQLCCSEGCNKVCKDPVTFQPLKPQPKTSTNSRNFNQRRY